MFSTVGINLQAFPVLFVSLSPHRVLSRGTLAGGVAAVIGLLAIAVGRPSHPLVGAAFVCWVAIAAFDLGRAWPESLTS